MMDYRNADKSGAAQFIADRILEKLNNDQSVLWLMSGGSGGQLCVAVSKLLQGHDLSKLHATMSDERYGDLGHRDENFTQLIRDGLSLPAARLYRPLTGDTISVATRKFSKWLASTHEAVDCTIATLGIGEDGHTSGVKPYSIGVTSSEAAVYFEGDDFARITTTLAFIRSVDEATVQAYGENKHAIIQQLIMHNSTPELLPILVVYEIPNVTIFSDYRRENT